MKTKRYKIFKDRAASLKEVFENLKGCGEGLKLLYFNKRMNNVSEVSWFSVNKIEIITIENDKVVAQYFPSFPFNSVVEMKNCGNKSFASADGWFIGYIKD